MKEIKNSGRESGFRFIVHVQKKSRVLFYLLLYITAIATRLNIENWVRVESICYIQSFMWKINDETMPKIPLTTL